MMPADWTIRPAGAADAPALAAFAERTFLETFGHLYPEADKAAYCAVRFTAARALADMEAPGRRILLAHDSAGLAGYCDMGGLEVPAPDPPAGALELHRLYLDQRTRGTGLADRLMAETFDWARARGAPVLYLGVWAHNGRALAFYRRHGFEIVGAYQFRVGNTLDDERIMRRHMRAA